jgi:clan AA aspartic protease (TIGR02281 family)
MEQGSRSVCMMADIDQSNGGSIGLAVASDDSYFTLRMFKPTWKIPTTVPNFPVSINFRDGKGWPAATAYPLDSGNAAGVPIEQTAIHDFIRELTADNSVTVSFSKGTEPPWTFSLTGATAVSDAFFKCTEQVNPKVAAQLTPTTDTQPFAQPSTAPATQPFATTPAASTVPTATVRNSSAPLSVNQGTYMVVAQVNGTPLNFVLDSGAGSTQLPRTVIAKMLANGSITANDYMGDATMIDANGRETKEPTYRLRSVTVGDITVHDVIVNAGLDPNLCLLGQSFLGRLKSWSIDNQAGRLLMEAV